MSVHSPKLVLNFATGSVSFGFSLEGSQELKLALDNLVERLRAIAGASGMAKQAQESIDFRRQEEGLILEVFCNPNIWSSPHAAKVLVTLKSQQVRLSTEAELSRLLEDLNQFMEAA